MSSATLALAALAVLLLAVAAMMLGRARACAGEEAARALVTARTDQVRARYRRPAEPDPVAPARNLRRHWSDLLRRAGLAPSRRTYARWGVPMLAACALAALAGGPPAGATAALLVLPGAGWLLWRRTVRLHRQMCAQLPGFLDGVVRLMTIGSAVPAAFQNAIHNTDAPLRDCLVQAVHLQRAGKELDQAVAQIARVYHFGELAMLASVLRLATRYGGRADIVMERTAAYMRDREQAQRELAALSAETRLSAWILGLLPIVVAGLMFALNAGYLLAMWRDPAGRTMLLCALGLELAGAVLLYRLARAV
ncbi:tight adherence protein B [Cupriavidus gilardii J11]|uniref:Tight adherence protein B n=1 Tax=Cupriavidus gilardii J11 TaxID=936133 RepID=A0A562B9D7_9BURK|nr:type II secretion system F family protein [Cupriavidus gilardii]TWG81801.1 tight adherence protein B [Cupriavidus gilardii J11]